MTVCGASSASTRRCEACWPTGVSMPGPSAWCWPWSPTGPWRPRRSVRVRPRGAQLAPYPRPLRLGQMMHHVALLVNTTPGDHRLVAEHVAHRGGQRLAAVEHEEGSLGRVQAAVAQASDEVAHHRLVLGRALHHPKRHLRPVRGDAERADHGVTSEVEPVDEADQPALIVEWPGPELGQPLGGGGDEPASHGGLRRARRRRLDRLADRFEGPFVAAAGQASKHRGDHVVGDQVDRRERVVGLQMHLSLPALRVRRPR